MKFRHRVFMKIFRRNKPLPRVGDLIEVLLDYNQAVKILLTDKIITYSGGKQDVERLEFITKLGKSYLGQCGAKYDRLYIHLQTTSIKGKSWLVWCEDVYVKKNNIWKTIAGWK